MWIVGIVAVEAAPGGFGCQVSAGRGAQLGEDVREVGLDRAEGDEHALADLAVGATGGDVAHDLELGRGQAVPAAGWPFSLAASPADIADRLIGAQCCARGEGGVVAVVSERFPGWPARYQTNNPVQGESGRRRVALGPRRGA